jgi:hypothetical protein
MKAEILCEFSRLLSGDETVIVECEGYELEVYGIEYDEFEEVLRLKAHPAGDEDETPPWLENDDEDAPGSVHGGVGATVCPIEPPQSQDIDIRGLELKEG